MCVPMLSLQVKDTVLNYYFLNYKKKIAWLKLKVLSHNLFYCVENFSGFLCGPRVRKEESAINHLIG